MGPKRRRPAPSRGPFPLAALAAGLLLLSSEAHGKIVEGVVAVVDNQAVTFSEVRKAASEALGVDTGEADSILREERDPAKVRGYLAPLVDSLLVRRELARAGQPVSDADVDRLVESIRKQNGLDEGAFRKAVEGEGMSFDAYRERLRWQFERSTLLRVRKGKEISVAEEEAREWYRVNGERFAEGGELRLAVLLLPFGGEEEKDRTREARLAARAAEPLLAAGKGLDEVASRLSATFPGVRLLPAVFVAEEELPEELRREARRLRTGETSAPFFTEEGGRVISVLERRGGKTPDFADAREQVVAELTELRSEKAFADLMAELRGGAVVEYRF